MLKRTDCLSVALILEAREHELSRALARAACGERVRLIRERAEVRRLRQLFDHASGRALDFACPRQSPVP
jgi:hypothetical protein